MNTIDKHSCTKCGACVKECLNSVIVIKNDGFPAINNPEFCTACGRCMARCPSGAVRINGLSRDRFQKIPENRLISPETMAMYLQSKRSCRRYRPEKIKKEELDMLINIAQIAPTSINCQEKTFIIIQDDKLISSIRKTVLKKSGTMYRLFRMLTRPPLKFLLPKDSLAYFKKLVNDYKGLFDNAAKGIDHLFYNTPCLVFFTGIAADPFGKDHALHAMNYFMLLAGTLGIGTCINGFAAALPKTLARFVNVPKMYKIYGVISAGYEDNPFTRTISRKEPEAEWYL